MRKRLLSVLLAGTLSVSAIAGSVISASAIRNADDTYTPGEGTETINYKFAMPGVWVSDVTKAQNNACGTYWWGGTDIPKDVFAHEWPGYKMYKDSEIENLYSIAIPTDVPMIIFNNFIDGGMDTTKPEFEAACQILDKNVESTGWGDLDMYTDEFWEYVYSEAAEELGVSDLDPASDELLEEIEYRADELTFEKFGDYAGNFSVDTEYGSGIVYSRDNMVFVVDLRPETMKVSTTIVPEGKITYNGEFFFSYGGGKYGVWPTLEIAVEQEGLTLDENGNVVTEGLPKLAYDEKTGNPDPNAVASLQGLALDKYDNVVKAIDGKLVYIYGDFTGKYWEDTEAPPTPSVDPETTTVPPADNKDATSATKSPATGDSPSNKNNNANGSIATGEFSFAMVSFVVVVAGLGVVYFTRRKYNK